MQEHYLVNRRERFQCIVKLIRATQPSNPRILDLGCGPGSLTFELANAFPQAEIWALDFDTTLLALARLRFADNPWVKFIQHDIRDRGWLRQVHQNFHAVVSSTALHWLSPLHLEAVYFQIRRVLEPNGLFANADHAATKAAVLQRFWQKERDSILRQGSNGETWSEYMDAFGREISASYQELWAQLHPWDDSVEEGMPLEWHFEKLKQAGFCNSDCFWRLGCDAVYGGFAPPNEETDQISPK